VLKEVECDAVFGQIFYQTFLLPPGCIILLLAAASFWQYKRKIQMYEAFRYHNRNTLPDFHAYGVR